VGLALVIAAGVAESLGHSWLWLAAAVGFTLLPALLLGLKTSLQVQRPIAFLPLAVLYFTYGLARLAALFKR
jgi:hypothetical protein